MTALATAIGKQLARPTGWRGRLVGAAMRVANRRATALAIEALAVAPGNAVLDFGCGAGDAIPCLSRRARDGQIYGIDHSADMIAAAARRHAHATFHCASFTALPLPAASVDRVLATNVAYFWYDDGAVLDEIRRVLRPGGRLSVYVTAASALRRAGLGNSGTHRLFDRYDLARILGPRAKVENVDAGFGVAGLIGTLWL